MVVYCTILLTVMVIGTIKDISHGLNVVILLPIFGRIFGWW